ncbi:MAG: phosphoglyceromutase [Lentisphaerae bacterium ADurb.BinA184]|nr:MAG: phosphoglyceromutase [Lentisphaerae bacterium ADurb.BinA184]
MPDNCCQALAQPVILLLIDGVGLPRQGLADSVYAAHPALMELFTGHTVPLDAGLGVPGIPQSATGQTAILTGVNAAALLGEHQPGFPGPRLREVIERENLFRKVLAAGRSCCFANAYARPMEAELPMPMRSVTTVAMLQALRSPLNKTDLLAGRAVYHDLTRSWLAAHGVADVPLISEEQAADDLLHIARGVDLCVFEYFLTDHAGHRAGDERAKAIVEVLTSFDRFLGRLMAGMDGSRELLLLVSDHGNTESPETRGHTTHAVPFAAWGCGAAEARRGMRSIVQVTPRVLEMLVPRRPA